MAYKRLTYEMQPLRILRARDGIRLIVVAPELLHLPRQKTAQPLIEAPAFRVCGLSEAEQYLGHLPYVSRKRSNDMLPQFCGRIRTHPPIGQGRWKFRARLLPIHIACRLAQVQPAVAVSKTDDIRKALPISAEPLAEYCEQRVRIHIAMQLDQGIHGLLHRRPERERTRKFLLSRRMLSCCGKKTRACRRHRTCPCSECRCFAARILGLLIELHRTRQYRKCILSRCIQEKAEPPIKVRQMWECLACRMRRCDLLGKRNILLFHRVEQEVMEVALRTDGRDIFLQGRTHIEERRCILSKTIIGIGEIAIVPRTKSLLMDPPLHQGKVARVLGTDTPRRVPHVADGEGDGLMIELRCTVPLLERLMYAPLIE